LPREHARGKVSRDQHCSSLGVEDQKQGFRLTQGKHRLALAPRCHFVAFCESRRVHVDQVEEHQFLGFGQVRANEHLGRVLASCGGCLVGANLRTNWQSFFVLQLICEPAVSVSVADILSEFGVRHSVDADCLVSFEDGDHDDFIPLPLGSSDKVLKVAVRPLDRLTVLDRHPVVLADHVDVF